LIWRRWIRLGVAADGIELKSSASRVQIPMAVRVHFL
jgi:hypothetical protein